MMGLVRARVVAASGGVMMLISSGLPWFHAASGADESLVVPLTNGVLRSAVWLLVLGIAVGLALLVTTDSPALLGCCSALWLNTSVVVWMFGSKSSWLFPLGVLPDRTSITVAIGVSVGLLGAILAVVGSALVLADQTWTMPDIRLPLWTPIGALLLLFCVVATREIPWANVSWGEKSWGLDFGAVPLLGDALALALVVVVFLLLATVFRPRFWVAVSLIGVGTVIVIDGVFALGSSALVVDITALVIEQLDVATSEVEVTTTRGPFAILVFGGALVTFGIATLRQFDKGERLPRRPAEQRQTPQDASRSNDDPFLSF